MSLKEYRDKLVKLDSLEEYNELMRLYAGVGWVWCSGEHPCAADSEVDFNLSYRYEIKNEFGYFSLTSPYEVITLQEFKELQGIFDCDTCCDTGKVKTMECYGGDPIEVESDCPDCMRWLNDDDDIVEHIHTGDTGLNRIVEDIEEAKKVFPEQIKVITKKGDTNMSNCVVKQDLEKMVIAICAPGIAKKDVKVRADEENNQLIVSAVPTMKFPELVKDVMELEISERMEVPQYFSPIAATVTVTNGMIIVEIVPAPHITELEVK